MNCQNANTLMHDYLDADIDDLSSKSLFEHLEKCSICNQHFNQLQAVEQRLRLMSHSGFTPDYIQKVIKQLPHKQIDKHAKRQSLNRWFKNHPGLVAASIFLMFFAISLFSYAIPGNELKIVASEYNNLIIDGNEVIVPEGEEIEGDLIVENGSLEIRGKVKGNVTVIDGELLMANASHVDGNTRQIDQLFEWLWYQIEKLYH